MVPYVLVYFYSLVMSNMKMISEIRIRVFLIIYQSTEGSFLLKHASSLG